MKALTISEAFRTQIGSRNVLRGFFSTYSFEADFFELEVLPLLLGSPALSPNETIRYHQLQSLMREHRGRWAVAYDVDVFDPQQAPRLEVDYLPIRVGGACQHAKLSILLVEGRDKQPALLLAAGSFNLTKAGWWENLEVGHWVELRSGYAPGNILRPLREALDFFHQNGTSAALDALREFASGLEVTADEPGCGFYFSGAGSDRLAFPRFLDEQAPERGALEVISPFFPEQGTIRSSRTSWRASPTPRFCCRVTSRAMPWWIGQRYTRSCLASRCAGGSGGRSCSIVITPAKSVIAACTPRSTRCPVQGAGASLARSISATRPSCRTWRLGFCSRDRCVHRCCRR